MLLTATREAGELRVYVTRFASVVTYFTEDASTGGMKLYVEPGFISIPSEVERLAPYVREAALEEAARRLEVSPAEVLTLSLNALRERADPDVPEYYRYASRRRAPARPSYGR